MLALVSPAKKLDFTELAAPITHSQPDFLDRSQVLINSARKLSRAELSRLMKLSDKLTELNFQRFKAFAPPFTTANAKQAILAFSGDTYVGFDAASLSEDDLVYAQDHLRILSGLYGLLRPLDLVQPYRLEMGSRLQNPEGSDLYAFWADDLAEAIDRAVSGHNEPVVINLASNEYFKAARAKNMKARVITPVFKEVKDGEAKVLGMFAKRARGMMARFMISKRIEKSEKLKKFSDGGYAYQDHLSDDDNWVFTRER
ncbi:MAG: peroxide stress protein YaaA [Rhodospirillaceae bacterium]|nr:peroxide stress protein YaaA [Rhodospirillaceae bacterium]